MTVPLFDTSGKDKTEENRIYREMCMAEFGLEPEPREYGRYPAGYWKECYEYWKVREYVSRGESL